MSLVSAKTGTYSPSPRLSGSLPHVGMWLRIPAHQTHGNITGSRFATHEMQINLHPAVSQQRVFFTVAHCPPNRIQFTALWTYVFLIYLFILFCRGCVSVAHQHLDGDSKRDNHTPPDKVELSWSLLQERSLGVLFYFDFIIYKVMVDSGGCLAQRWRCPVAERGAGGCRGRQWDPHKDSMLVKERSTPLPLFLLLCSSLTHPLTTTTTIPAHSCCVTSAL